MAGIVAFLGLSLFQTGTTIAERLVNFRKARGNTQKALAAQIGVDQSTLAKWERGERLPTGEFLRRVEKVCGSAPSGAEP